VFIGVTESIHSKLESLPRHCKFRSPNEPDAVNGNQNCVQIIVTNAADHQTILSDCNCGVPRQYICEVTLFISATHIVFIFKINRVQQSQFQ
jgi:hypothetical protein